MVLRFRVSNHLSIRDPQELSFVASSLKDGSAGLIDCPAAPNGSLLPAAVIYGPNASGKSNLIDAIHTMKWMVLWSQRMGEPIEELDYVIPRYPFKLDPASSEMPSCFDIDFVVNGVQHHYGFKASSTFFEAEWLYAFPRSQRRTLFQREKDKFYFGRGLKGKNTNIADLTRPNSLYLSAAAQYNHEQLSKIFDFFRSLLLIRGITVRSGLASESLTKIGMDSRVIDFLKKINTGVIAYRRQAPKSFKDVRDPSQERFVVMKKIFGPRGDIEMDFGEKRDIFELAYHGREGKPIYFELDRESAGTRRLLILLNFAYRALDHGLPLWIDELDASLHTQASEEVLKLFCSPETNPKGAQLMATTHDTNLMQSPVLRRDQVWFTEKDSDGATQLYPLTDIRTRKGDNIERGYLQGRYGAVPFNP